MVNPELILSAENKLEACRVTRTAAAGALKTVLGQLLTGGTPFSEAYLRDCWLAELRQNPGIFSDGWYLPPPHGMGVLIGTVDRNSRHNYASLRPEAMWPQPDIFFDPHHLLLYAYASPVDRETGMIGDFGVTVYRGNDPVIKNHLQQCLRINREIINYIQVGMIFSEAYHFASGVFRKYGLTNMVTSITDPSTVNIGHTVPASDDNWTSEEAAILKSGENNLIDIANLIKNKRKFVSPVEQTAYKPGMAVTLEPRLVNTGNPEIPMASFHTICIFNPDGTKELLTDFDDTFRLMGMDYMIY